VCVFCVSAPALAQIRVLNPFGARQGSVAPLLTNNLSTGYAKPALQSNGLAVKVFTWNGHSWSNDSGQTWNINVPYAVGLSTSKVRFELHDTTSDRGQMDPSDKRRSEVSSKDQFLNGRQYWMAFSFKIHWDCVPCQARTGQGGEIMQVHWPSGASPPLAFRTVATSTGAGFRITTRGDGQGNINRYTGPLTLDQVHDVVFNFQLGAVGFARVWLDGKEVLNLGGVPVGTNKEDGYSMRLGPYYAGGMAGNKVVQEYANIAAFPSTTSLSGRVTRSPVWPSI
jgi:hypothetical protein